MTFSLKKTVKTKSFFKLCIYYLLNKGHVRQLCFYDAACKKVIFF